ncbi:MAG: cytochrome c maturation protein CcmE [Anaerolineaceae bacterium]|nr:cytochrome c maturation protein CcmE [Anaerolineaceae bacterium]
MSKETKIVIGVVTGLFACSLIVGLLLVAGSGLYAARSAAQPSAQYFMTIGELLAKKDTMLDKQVRISGAVMGDSIQFDEATGKLTFFIADVPADYAQVEEQGGLAVVLKNAVDDPNRQTIQVVYTGVKPDLLRNMSQAIIVGKLDQEGTFQAEEILLKCPSRYEEAVPDQVVERP